MRIVLPGTPCTRPAGSVAGLSWWRCPQGPDDLGLLGPVGDLVVLEAEGPSVAAVGHARCCDLVHLATDAPALGGRFVGDHRREHEQDEEPVAVGDVDVAAGHEANVAKSGRAQDPDQLLQFQRSAGEAVDVEATTASRAPASMSATMRS